MLREGEKGCSLAVLILCYDVMQQSRVLQLHL
ncbi:hypothetical protein APH_0416 [Anaplasma phagocytophilum str. HZ]|uniref:Uncharacterized protein n=1 Tax=Anaplasma phagocytophilum (strain HZ) TaxID=212042 RepID=Q2GKT2_ANAPZ|nr:hypothetical protein APH_0416 [Anaplasma phagocytophilum str. HZ]